ncbi:conjugal transfer protein TraF [Synergistales bacterium]|nr:conjugal transfer protein TraF [Synergistales bacterium]
MKKKVCVFCLLLTSLCAMALALAETHHLGYRVNRSDSLPCLVYRITPLKKNEPIQRGDCVLIDLSTFTNSVIEQGIERGYVNRNEPMLKRISGIPGDTIVLNRNCLIVNGKATNITVASADYYGGKLRAYPTPITLSPDNYWLISDPARCFDSRYFGSVNRSAFTHKAYPVF